MADHLITIVEAVIIKFKLFLKFLFIYYLLICLHCWIVFSRSRLCELETVRQRLEIVLILTVISGFLKSVLYKKLFKVWGQLWCVSDTTQAHFNHSHSALLSVVIGLLVPELQNISEVLGDVFDKDVATVIGGFIPPRS